MRAVAYCRVSTDEQDQLNSLQNQKTHYQELFEKEGFTPVKVGMLFRKEGNKKIVEHLEGIFADEGISGTKLKNREAFKYMLECAKRREFDVILVKNVQRYARSVEDGAKTLKDLKEYGIKVIFEDGNLNSFDHELVINMFLSVAQEESRNKSVAVQFGVHKALQQGKWNAQVPYGYKIVNGYLQINELEIETVKKIFDFYLHHGWGTGKICRWLNNEKIPTKKGKQWSQTQINSILDNEIYTGRQVCHKEQTIDVNRNIRKKVNPDEWIYHQREELRIISDEEFTIVKEERKRRRELISKGHKTSTKHLFSNLLYCGNCGSNMKRKKRHSYCRKDGTRKDIGYEWTCAINDMYGKSRCEHRNAMPEDKLIEEIKHDILLEKNKNKDSIKYTIDRLIDLKYGQNINIESIIKNLQTEIEYINKQVKANFKLYTDEIISVEQYKKQNDELQVELKQKETELHKMVNREKDIENFRLKYQKHYEAIKQVDIENLTNAVLKQIYDRIYINRLPNGQIGIWRLELNTPQIE